MRSVITYISLGVLSVMALSACSDQFLEDKKNYDNVNVDVYNYYSGANGRLNDIYAQCQPWMTEMAQADANKRFTGVSSGLPDMASQSTEEYAGTWSDFVNPNVELTSGGSSGTAVPDFFMGKVTDIQQSTYGRIRNINDFIAGVEGSTLTQAQKDELLGQAHFWRAWMYFNLVKWYGGVPLVKEVQNPEVGTFTPRSTTKECIQFIVDECNLASSLLAAKTTQGGWSGSDWGRVTSGTALALKGRALVLWASPIFNRKGDNSRWTEAYAQMKADLPTIKACGHDLFSTSNNVNGSDFALQFMQNGKNPEAVLVTLHNNITTESDEQQNNPWEAKVRPSNTGGSGLAASAMLANLFPMADGKLPQGTGYNLLETSSTYNYDKNYPFVNRDPRFYRTFAFPGVKWPYNGDPTQKDGNNPSYEQGKEYVLWNYVWYTDMSKTDDRTGSDAARGADNFLTHRTSLYVRKKSDDAGIKGASPMYQYMPTYDQPFKTSAAPLIELRFAEVLLNLAEAACGAGDMAYAVDLLKQIRRRAGYKTADCGLQANLSSNKAACMSAILYERQIELAYEGKRFYDMRRWMLFDGGATKPANTPDTYTLTGWGGNTCTWLGVKPFNGQRRERIEFQTAKSYGQGGTTYDSDPLLKNGGTRNVIIDLDGATDDLTTQANNLKTWYQNNLYIVEKNQDPTDSGQNPEYISFRPKYYILGLKSSVQENNKEIPQTVGWELSSGGSYGTFDPLAN